MVLYLYHVGGRLVRSTEGTDYIGGEGQRLGKRRGVVGETFTQGCGEAGTSRQAGEEEDFADLYDNVNGDGDDSSDEDFALSRDGDAESDSESVVNSEEAVQSVANLSDQGDNGEGERHEERWEATGYLTDDNDEELNFVMREKQRIEAEIRGAGGFNNDGGGPILEGSGAGDMEGNVGNLAEVDDDVNATDEGGINVQASEQCGDKEVLVGFKSDEQGSYPSSSGESGCDSTGRTRSRTIWFNEKDKNPHFQEWMAGGQTSNLTNVDQSQANETIMAQSQSNTTSVNLIPTQNSVVAPTDRQMGGGRGRGRARGRGRGRGRVQVQLPPTSLTVGTPSAEQPQLPPSNVDQLDDEALAGIPDEILASMGTNSN
ncbi:hypothetical protein Tsubulata_038839, partial [Turnera subulata]